MFAISFLLVLTLGNNCSFTLDGTTYDLSALDGLEASGPDKKVSTYNYKASVCSNMADECQDIMTGKTLSGSVYQFGGGNQPGSKQVCWDVLAFWSSPITTHKLDPGTDGISADDTGIALHFANGDDCRNAPRKTTLNMICDADSSTATGKLEGFQDETDSCHFILNWRVKAACNGAPATTTSTAPPHLKWGINGTFQGDLECLTANNDCTLKTTDNQLRGDCDNMKLVTVTGGKYEVWEMEFEECGGYYMSGTMTGANTDLKFKMHGSYFSSTNKLEIQMVDSDFPYEAMYKLTMDRVDDKRRLLSLV